MIVLDLDVLGPLCMAGIVLAGVITLGYDVARAIIRRTRPGDGGES